MSCDHELANERARCSGKNASYITRSIVCYCTHEEKINCEGFTQNGCYGNQSRPLEVLFDSSDANNPYSFTKQDLIFKQAYLVGFCFVLFNKFKF